MIPHHPYELRLRTHTARAAEILMRTSHPDDPPLTVQQLIDIRDHLRIATEDAARLITLTRQTPPGGPTCLGQS